MKEEKSVDNYMGCLSSWASYRKYRALNPEKEDPLQIAFEKWEKKFAS